jgi:hypothetical protein
MVLKKYLLFCLVVFAGIINTTVVKAVTTRNWVGTTSTDWNTATNWAPSGVPASTDIIQIGVVAFTGHQPTIGDNETAKCSTLTLGTLTAATLTINNNNATLTVGSTVIVGSGCTITVNGTLSAGTTITVNNSGTITVNGTLAAGTSVTVGGTITVNGSLTAGAGGTVTVNNGGMITVTGGTLTANGAVTVANGGMITVTLGNLSAVGTVTINSGGTIAMNAFSTFTSGGTFNNAGTFTAEGAAATFNGATVTIINSGTFTALAATVTFSGNSETITNSGYFTAEPFLFFPTTVTISGNTSVLNNSGTFYATGSDLNLNGAPNTINNTSVFVVNNTPVSVTKANSAINNTKTFTDESSDITFSAALASSFNSITNSGVGTIFHSTGSNITLPTFANISNTTSAFFTADSASTISLGDKGSIINSAIFNAGTSNSSCSITSTTNASATQTMINNTGTFNVGSTSIITIGNTSGKTVTVVNTSPAVFTLESDQYGSASIGESGSTTNSFTGTYNVQRYMSGGSSAYRGYRLLSIPINISGVTNGSAANLSLAFLNQPASVTNANAVSGITTSYGVYTAGPGSTGLSTTISNPTIYLYNETYKDNNASFISGKNVGINTINGNTVTTISTATLSATGATVSPKISGATSIPVGNGVLLYYVGPGNVAPAAAPASTIITNIGTLNQQSISVNLWYTPGGATGTTTNKLSYTTGGADKYEFFNSVGNPYASTIDLKTVYTDNSTAIGPNFWELYDQNPNNGYVVYSKTGTSSPLASEYVVSGQGFFVVAAAVNKTLTFKEDQKNTINLTSPTLLLAKKDSPAPALNGIASTNRNLSTLNGGSSPQKSRAVITAANTLKGLHLQLSVGVMNESCGIYFDNEWSDKYDINDAYYLSAANNVVMCSYTSDGYKTAINKMADFTKSKNIKLYVSGVTDGNYNLTLTDFQNIDTTLFNIYLVDHKNQDSLDIVRYKTYAFTITNADTTSFGGNRLALDIERKPLPPYELISFTAQKVRDGVQLTWKTYNEGDFTGFGIQKLDEGKQYTTLYNVQSDGDGTYTYIDRHPVTGDNTYRLQQINIDSLVSYSKPLSVIYNVSTASSNLLSVYPNPARELITVNYSSTNPTSTNSYLSCIYNSEGKLVLQQTANSNTWTHDVSALKPGAYVVQVKAANGNSVGNAKFIRVQ